MTHPASLVKSRRRHATPKNFAVYRNPDFYAAHPSCCTAPNGDILVAFRRQPNRKTCRGMWNMHIDPDSHVCLVRSADGGKTWSDRQIVWNVPGVGNNDPCLTRLSDGRILLTFFNWEVVDALTRADAQGPNFTRDYHRKQPNNPWPGIFMMTGGAILHSDDAGRTWSEARTVAVPASYHGGRCAIQGKIAELPDGRLLLPVYAARGAQTPFESLCLLSEDRGLSFAYQGTIAGGQDDGTGFGENTLLALANGDVVSFLRPENDPGKTQALWLSRSKDQGKTWACNPVPGVKGVPQKAFHLSNGNVFLIYGYRFEPSWGVRARVIDPECRNIADATEIVIRDDGADADLGYPDAIEWEPGKILCVYYFSNEACQCDIEGSLLTLHS